MPLTAGSQIGSYEVVSLIGSGGMGEVYRARDRQLQRDVALKVLPDAFASDPDRLARFEREAQMLASLNHPNVAQIYGLEGSGALRCIVMELVDGETLQDRLRRGPIPIDEALAIAMQICDALEAAHARGIVHRDLKPGNIKITDTGKVKVLDFGLSKAMHPEAAADLSQSPTVLSGTVAGVIVGTAAYMSPEQARGKRADARSDIWAFGVVLYEMLVGKSAFEGETLVEILADVMKAEPDWMALPATTPAAVRSLLGRCLQKDRDRRYRDIADVKIQIEEALSAPAAGVVTAAPPRRAYAGWIAAAILALAVAALALPALTHMRETPAEPVPIRSTILAPEGTTLDFLNGASGLPALSPDGRRIVFVARTADGKQPLWVRSLDGLTAQPLAGTEGANFPFWSPDSRSIAFFADGKLKKIDAGGGAVITLADAPAGRGGSWSRAGVIIFAPTANPGLQRVSSVGGDSTPLPYKEGSVPSFLPDGQHFLYQEQLNAAEAPIHIGSLDGATSMIVGKGSNALYTRGYLVFLREGTLLAQPFDTNRLATTGEAVPLAERIQTVLASGRVGVSSTSDAGLLIYRQGESVPAQLTWFDRTGKEIGRVGKPDSSLVSMGFPELSPDGRRVAVDRRVQGNDDIWVIDLLRDAITRLTLDPIVDMRPLWSRDGSQIIFGSQHKGNILDLYVKLSNGVGDAEPLLESSNNKTPYSFSPDGRFLLYREDDSKTGSELRVLPMQGDRPSTGSGRPEPAEGRNPIVVANSAFEERYGQFSPDGRWIAYQSNESGRFEIYVVPFPNDVAAAPLTLLQNWIPKP